MEKKSFLSFLSIIILVFPLLAGCGQVVKEVSDQNIEKPNFEQVVQSINSPEECFSWLQSNIVYKPDATSNDEFRDPKATLQLGYGDCDDYARFADYVLKIHGYDSKIVSVFNSSTGHAVCVWQDAAGKLNYLSNLGVKKVEAADLKQVAKSVYQDWELYTIYPTQQANSRPVGE